MSLWRLWWLTILVPTVIVGAFDYVRHAVWPEPFHVWPAGIYIMALVLLCALLLTNVLSTYLQRGRARLSQTARDFAGLWVMTQRSSGKVEPYAMARRVLPRITDRLRLDAAAILLGESDKELLVGAHGISEEEVHRLLGAFREVEDKGRSYIWRKDVAGFRCATIVPLKAPESSLGSLLLATRRRPSSYARDGAVLAFLGQHLAVLFQIAQLHQQVQQLAALDERDRLGKEIHDSLAQELAYLNVKLEATRTIEMPPALRVELNEMLEVVRSAYMDVREWVGGLRDAQPTELGLAGFLERTVENFRRRTGIATTLEITGGSPPSLSPRVEVQLIRVVQEALANVRKHSRASNAYVILEPDGDMAKIVVGDNGVGFFASQAFKEGHFGLLTMRERVEGVGGALKISSYPGMGTRVEALLPAQGRKVSLATY